MKIALMLDDSLDYPDGVQQYVLLLGQWLTDHGHEVHYIASQTTRTDIQNLHSLATNRRVRFNKNVMRIPVPVKRRELERFLSQHTFDVIHIQMPYSPQFGARLVMAAPASTAIVATFHIAAHSSFVELSTKLLGSVERRSLKRLDDVVSVSSVAQALASKTFGIASDVVPNAIDISRWQSAKPVKKTKSIVFLGRLVNRKGCQHLLQALTYIDAAILSQLTVTIAGDGPDRNKLELLVATHGLQDAVTFTGFISEDEKRQLLSQAGVAVFPATGGESFGIVLLEAMAAGALTLAGDNPGYHGVMESCAKALFTPSDHQALAELIVQSLTNQSFNRLLVEQQQKLVKQFDINVVGGQIEGRYRAAIAKRQALAHNNP